MMPRPANLLRTGCRPGLLALTLVGFLTLEPASSSLAGQVLRWVDAQGHVHYGDRPPPQGGAETLKLPGATGAAREPVPAADHRTRQRRLLRAYETERVRRGEARAKTKRERAARARRCEALSARIEAMKRARYLYREKTPGQRDVLSREARAARIAKLEKLRRQRCG